MTRSSTSDLTDSERKDRIIASNLASSQQTTFGYDPKTGGGIFQLKRIGYDDAEFYFRSDRFRAQGSHHRQQPRLEPANDVRLRPENRRRHIPAKTHRLR